MISNLCSVAGRGSPRQVLKFGSLRAIGSAHSMATGVQASEYVARFGDNLGQSRAWVARLVPAASVTPNGTHQSVMRHRAVVGVDNPSRSQVYNLVSRMRMFRSEIARYNGCLDASAASGVLRLGRRWPKLSCAAIDLGPSRSDASLHASRAVLLPKQVLRNTFMRMARDRYLTSARRVVARFADRADQTGDEARTTFAQSKLPRCAALH